MLLLFAMDETNEDEQKCMGCGFFLLDCTRCKICPGDDVGDAKSVPSEMASSVPYSKQEMTQPSFAELMKQVALSGEHQNFFASFKNSLKDMGIGVFRKVLKLVSANNTIFEKNLLEFSKKFKGSFVQTQTDAPLFHSNKEQTHVDDSL